jgi:hypothetical protein
MVLSRMTSQFKIFSIVMASRIEIKQAIVKGWETALHVQVVSLGGSLLATRTQLVKSDCKNKERTDFSYSILMQW